MARFNAESDSVACCGITIGRRETGSPPYRRLSLRIPIRPASVHEIGGVHLPEMILWHQGPITFTAS